MEEVASQILSMPVQFSGPEVEPVETIREVMLHAEGHENPQQRGDGPQGVEETAGETAVRKTGENVICSAPDKKRDDPAAKQEISVELRKDQSAKNEKRKVPPPAD